MKIDQKISFIGAGNMASALIKGLITAAVCKPQQIMASDVSKEHLEALQKNHSIRTTHYNRQAAQEADIVVLSTKPQIFPELLPEISSNISKNALVVSIAAGIPIVCIETNLPEGTRVIRTMPNTPALIGEGFTGIAKGKSANQQDLKVATEIFGSVGKTQILDESLLDVVTGLCGSGPAYLFAFVEALVHAGQELGLAPDIASTMVAQTILGSAKLLNESNEGPARLREKVTSPGGTTFAGLKSLEADGFTNVVAKAIQSATHRSKELGDEAIQKLQKVK